MKCGACGVNLEVGDWPFCPHGSVLRRDAQDFIPPVVFKALDTESAAQYLFPGRSDEATPRGYSRIELKTRRDVTRFEREYNQYAKSVHAAILEVERERYRCGPLSRRSEIERVAKDGPPNLRRYAEHLLYRMDRRDFSREAQRYDSGFHVEAFHHDAVNRSRCDDPRQMPDRARR